MEQKTKNRIYIFLLSLFVAVIFISSYGTFNNNEFSQTVASTTVQNGQTFVVFGSANGIVSGYSSSAQVQITGNSSVSTAVGNTLQKLQANSSITEYFPYGDGYNVFLNTINPYQLEQLLNQSANAVSINATSYVQLPSAVELYSGNQGARVTIPSRNYTLTIIPLQDIGSNVPVSIRAIVTTNGLIYNNQIIVSQKT